MTTHGSEESRDTKKWKHIINGSILGADYIISNAIFKSCRRFSVGYRSGSF